MDLKGDLPEMNAYLEIKNHPQLATPEGVTRLNTESKNTQSYETLILG